MRTRQLFKTIGFGLLTLIGVTMAALVGLFVATDGEQSVPHTVATDTTLPRVEIDGVTFHAETFGDAANPTVVVVHGGPGGDYGYLLNLHELSDEYFVVFYDQRGAGLSPRVPAEELTLQSSIDDLHRIVSHYGQGETVRLVGHSWGAMLVAAYVGQHPDSAAQVVLAEPGALDNAGLARFSERQAASAWSFAYYRLLVSAIFESLHLDGPDAEAQMDYIYGQMSANFTNTAASGYRCEDENVVAVQPDVPVPPRRFGATAYKALFNPEADLSPIAANADNFRGDVLFMASECSRFIGEAFQRGQMGLFPQAKLVVIPDAGHEMIGENPVESLAAIRAYFDGGDS